MLNRGRSTIGAFLRSPVGAFNCCCGGMVRLYWNCTSSTTIGVRVETTSFDPDDLPYAISVKVSDVWTCWFDRGASASDTAGYYIPQDDAGFQEIEADPDWFAITDISQIQLVIEGVGGTPGACLGERCELISADGVNGIYTPTLFGSPSNDPANNVPACLAAAVNAPSFDLSAPNRCRARFRFKHDAAQTPTTIIRVPTNMPSVTYHIHSADACSARSGTTGTAFPFVTVFSSGSLRYWNCDMEVWLRYNCDKLTGRGWKWTFHLSQTENSTGSFYPLYDDGRLFLNFLNCGFSVGFVSGCGGLRAINSAYPMSWDTLLSGGLMTLLVAP